MSGARLATFGFAVGYFRTLVLALAVTFALALARLVTFGFTTVVFRTVVVTLEVALADIAVARYARCTNITFVKA